MNILIVEDEALTVMYLKMLLKQMDYTEVKSVASGEKALELVDEWKPQLVFMDIQLAGKLDGIETTVQLKQKVECPVVYTTGYDNPEIMDRATRSGSAAYLIKPVERESIRTVLQTLFA
ncbi:MAG: response regulator [Spirochaetes bacterium]|nr:response regulator [Spirochaetota bacterium]MBU0956319.1 response regulator [Spirochaetota bacterium]